jgi:pSer/pThr/pTyr-binding forkhead associated (FHA) protein
MANRTDLADYAASLANLSEHTELQERLKLYQVFLKLYEHHRGLLDEILELETSGSRSLARVTLPYVQGFVSGEHSYLVTNLLRGKTQALMQPQQVWVIGRDPKRALIPIQDIRLSRCHAAIKFIKGQGFYLIDLDSRNQSLVNGEPVRQSLLKDGDQVRLGSVSFTFFLCQSTRILPSLTPELVDRLDQCQDMALEERLGRSPRVRESGYEEDEVPTLDLYPDPHHETSGFLHLGNQEQRSL